MSSKTSKWTSQNPILGWFLDPRDLKNPKYGVFRKFQKSKTAKSRQNPLDFGMLSALHLQFLKLYPQNYSFVHAVFETAGAKQITRPILGIFDQNLIRNVQIWIFLAKNGHKCLP